MVLLYQYLYHCPAFCQVSFACVCVCVDGDSEGLIWKEQSRGERLKDGMGGTNAVASW